MQENTADSKTQLIIFLSGLQNEHQGWAARVIESEECKVLDTSIERKQSEVIELMLDNIHQTLRLTASTKQRTTPLHIAARKGNIKLAEALLNSLTGRQKTLLLSVKDESGETASTHAEKTKNNDMKKLLKEFEERAESGIVCSHLKSILSKGYQR